MMLISLAQASTSKKTVLVTSQPPDNRIIDIAPYLYWLNGNDTVLFSKAKGLINQPHRFIFYIQNKANQPLSLVVNFGERYQYVSAVYLYSLVTNKPTFSKGYHNVIPLQLQPGETKIIGFKVAELNRENPTKVEARLVSQDFVEKTNVKMQIRQAFFLGLFAFVCLFNVIIYFVTGWKIYFKYALFIFFSLLYFLYFFGILQELLPWVKTISHNLVRTWYSLIFISYFYFINEFGNYKNHVPRAYKLLNLGIGFKLTESVFITIVHYMGAEFIYSQVYKYAILVFEVGLMGFILFYILKNKNLRGRIVILAASIMVIGGIVDQVFVTKNYDHFYFMEIAIVVELLTFSVGLGYITKLYFEEKQQNQQLYINELQKNKRHQAELNEVLENRVKQRTAELEEEKNNVILKSKENEILLGEIHHRVKNNLQTITSLLSIQQRKLKDEDSIKVLEDSKNRVAAMGLIHQHLYQNDTFSEIDFSSYTHDLVRMLLQSNATFSITLNCNIPKLKIALDDAIYLGLLINELVLNCIKHAYKGVKNPILEISIYPKNSHVALCVKDNGISTNINLNQSNSFGWKMVQSIVAKLGGTMHTDTLCGLTIEILFDNHLLEIV